MIAVENKTCKVLKIKNICFVFIFNIPVKNYHEINENALFLWNTYFYFHFLDTRRNCTKSKHLTVLTRKQQIMTWVSFAAVFKWVKYRTILLTIGPECVKYSRNIWIVAWALSTQPVAGTPQSSQNSSWIEWRVHSTR